MDKVELKACPFCGRAAEITSCRTVQCIYCGALNSNVRQWNTRTPDPIRLEAALRDIAGAVRIGSETDPMSWFNLANACQQTARTALTNNTTPK